VDEGEAAVFTVTATKAPLAGLEAVVLKSAGTYRFAVAAENANRTGSRSAPSGTLR